MQSGQIILTEVEVPPYAQLVLKQLMPLINDTDIEVSKLTIDTFATIFLSKRGKLCLPSQILRMNVLKACFINQYFVRDIDMGPFKHTIDHGIEARKSAYDLLNLILTKDSENLVIENEEFYQNVFVTLKRGLDDVHDIRISSCKGLLLLNLLAPAVIKQNLESSKARNVMTSGNGR